MQVENLGPLATPFSLVLRALGLLAYFGRDQICTIWRPDPIQPKLSDVYPLF